MLCVEVALAVTCTGEPAVEPDLGLAMVMTGAAEAAVARRKIAGRLRRIVRRHFRKVLLPPIAAILLCPGLVPGVARVARLFPRSPTQHSLGRSVLGCIENSFT